MVILEARLADLGSEGKIKMPRTDTMLERLARTLHKASYERGRCVAPDYPTGRLEREMWEFSARAALSAMREATEAMLEIGIKNCLAVNFGKREADIVWQVMIDEALK